MAWWLRKHTPKGAEAQRIGYSAEEPATAHRLTMADETKQINLRLPPRLLRHVDAQREHYGMSRPSYLKQLIIDDIRRQGPTGRTALAPRTAPEPTRAV
jgi:hypothetical protein